VRDQEVIESGNSIWQLVLDDMRKREQFGKSKYGKYLEAHDGRDTLLDAYEEALDLVVYLRKAMEERKNVGEKR
jgi:hypothetical protein